MRTNLLRVASGLPVEPLAEKIRANPWWWNEITDRQDYPGSAHHDTKAIFLRWCPGRDIESAFTDVVAVAYPRGLDLLREWVSIVVAIRHMLPDPDPEVGRVIVASLKPGGRIDEHADEGLYADTFERFHVALNRVGDVLRVQRADGVDEYVTMLPGEAWWFNHKQPHTCTNYGDEERWHLIIDMKAPQYRRERGDT